MHLTHRSTTIAPSATLALAQKARELALEGKDVVSLTTGEPDFPTAPHIIEAMKTALDRGKTKYTAVSGMPELREAIVKYYRARGRSYEAADVIVSTGAKQSIFNAVLSLVEEGDEAIVTIPYWLSYSDMVTVAGGRVVEVVTREEESFIPRAEEIEAAITKKTRVLFLNSPSNPAGAVFERDELAALAAVLARHPEITIISDEIYDCFVYGGRRAHSLLDVAPELADRTLLVNGCSKRYAMTGLRIGWAAGPRSLISAMGRLQGQSTSNTNAAAQVAAVAALEGDQSPLERMLEAFDVRRRFVMGRLTAIPGVTCFDPHGAFYVFPNMSAFVGRTLPDGSTINDAYSLTAHLLHDHSLVVIPGGPFGMRNHIRMSFAADMQMLSKGLDRLAAAIAGLR